MQEQALSRRPVFLTHECCIFIYGTYIYRRACVVHAHVYEIFAFELAAITWQSHHIHVCLCFCVCIYIYTHMCVHIYVYTYTYADSSIKFPVDVTAEILDLHS